MNSSPSSIILSHSRFVSLAFITLFISSQMLWLEVRSPVSDISFVLSSAPRQLFIPLILYYCNYNWRSSYLTSVQQSVWFFPSRMSDLTVNITTLRGSSGAGTDTLALLAFGFGIGVLTFFALLNVCPPLCRLIGSKNPRRYEDKSLQYGEINIGDVWDPVTVVTIAIGCSNVWCMARLNFSRAGNYLLNKRFWLRASRCQYHELVKNYYISIKILIPWT